MRDSSRSRSSSVRSACIVMCRIQGCWPAVVRQVLDSACLRQHAEHEAGHGLCFGVVLLAERADDALAVGGRTVLRKLELGLDLLDFQCEAVDMGQQADALVRAQMARAGFAERIGVEGVDQLIE